jgi:hypothetical protein
MKPQIIIENLEGKHNSNLEASRDRLIQGATYQDLSTICIVPTRGSIPAKVVQSWMNLMAPMNQKFTRIFICGMEVGEAYNGAIDAILGNPDLQNWRYILTLEEDNMPPPDGLLKLYEGMKDFDVVGGLYWTKGEGGQPMIYGDPHEMPLNFRPQLPINDAIQPCMGLGMGFTLFKTSIFKDTRIPRPFFKTMQEYSPDKGLKMMTQDLYFFENISRFGYKVACNTRCKVGHYDYGNDLVW